MPNLWVGPLVWKTENGKSFWDKPNLSFSFIDLRSNVQCSTPIIPLGFGLFIADDAVNLGSNYRNLGNDLERTLTENQKRLWESQFNLPETLRGNKLWQVIWETLTIQADPDGELRAKPIVPNIRQNYELWFNRRLIFSKGFKPTEDEWRPVIDLLKKQYRKIRQECLDGKLPENHYRKVLGNWVKKYGLTYRQFQPSDLPDEEPLIPTTIFSDDFNRANETLTSPWALLNTSVLVVDNNEVLHNTSGDFGVATARYNADLSSDDHYTKIDYVNAAGGDAQFAVNTRHDVTNYTFYYFTIYDAINVAENWKVVSGVFTRLEQTGHSPVNNDEIKSQCDGSTIKGFINGVEESSVTDSAISGNLRGGIWTYKGAGSAPRGDNYESADLATPINVNAVPTNLPLVTVAPNKLIQSNLVPTSLTLSTVAPNKQLATNLVPTTIVLTLVAPTNQDVHNVETADFSLLTVAVYQQLEYNATPINIDIIHDATFDALIQIECNSIPVNFIFSIVETSREHHFDTTPANLVLSSAQPSTPTHILVGALNLELSAVVVLVIGGEPPSAIIITTPEPIEAKSNLFAAFNERLKFVNPIVSEYVLENTKFPYVSLGQVYNILSWKNSCLQRFEESEYTLKVYTENFIELEDRVKAIENTLIYDTILLANPKKVISLEQIGKEIEEIKRELYCCILAYEIIVQKDINTTYISSITSGETLNKCIYERSKLIKHTIGDFVSPGYALEKTKLPYITVPKISEELSWQNTKGRIDEIKYPITVKSEDLYELLDIMNEIEVVFDYAKFNINNKNHLINEWVGTEIIEIEPQLWCGKVNYEILVESTINEYNES